MYFFNVEERQVKTFVYDIKYKNQKVFVSVQNTNCASPTYVFTDS